MTDLSMDAPGYWMNETSGRLRPVIQAYLEGKDLTEEQAVLMRAYFRQWINAPKWVGPVVEELRFSVEAIKDRHGVTVWLSRAGQVGIDPL